MNYLLDQQKLNDKETCPQCFHPWDAHTEDVGCTIGHTNYWCQCDSSLRKYLDGVEKTSDNRALALEKWEADANKLALELHRSRQRIAELEQRVERLTKPVSMDELPIGTRIGAVRFNQIISSRAALSAEGGQ